MLNSGIYALWWENEELIYVGQSTDLSSRSRDHYRKMKCGVHYNVNVQAAFNKLGYPEFIVLEEEPNPYNLNKAEMYWIKELEAYNTSKGLNRTEGGDKRAPYLNKFSKIQIYKAFICIYKYKYTRLQTAARSRISTHAIKDLVQGRKYTWLKHLYPEQWKVLKLTGEENRKQNWKFQSVHSNKDVFLRSPFGDKVLIDRPYSELCAKYSELTPTGISRLVNGRALKFKGWNLW